jgi:Uma2 family endonuclease
MTTAEYLRTPQSLLPTELAHGVLRVADSPSPRHQSAVKAFLLALHPFVEERGLGEIWLSPLDVILDEARALVVQPDLVFISTARSGIVRDRVRGAPDMVLEVLSPYPRVGNTQERLEWYARYGVRESWVLRLGERRLDILTAEEGRIARRVSFAWSDPIETSVFPGFTRSLSAILGLW